MPEMEENENQENTENQVLKIKVKTQLSMK